MNNYSLNTETCSYIDMATNVLDNLGSSYGLLPDSTKLLPQPK